MLMQPAFTVSPEGIKDRLRRTNIILGDRMIITNSLCIYALYSPDYWLLYTHRQGCREIGILYCVQCIEFMSIHSENTNPISIKVGTLSKNAIKTNNCNLLNHLNFYLTDKSTQKTFSLFSLSILIAFLK